MSPIRRQVLFIIQMIVKISWLNFPKLHYTRNEERFEAGWKDLLTLVNRENFKSYLVNHIYERKKKWGVPWVGRMMTFSLSTTSFSESANNAIKSKIGKNTSLEDSIRIICNYADEKINCFPDKPFIYPEFLTKQAPSQRYHPIYFQFRV